MQYSTCASRDFYHPEFTRLSRLAGEEPFYHRKLWEYVFILHHAFRTGVVAPGKRGLVFGVGSEPLPATFAQHGVHIMATDAPAELQAASEWLAGEQYAAGLGSIPERDMDRAAFERLVSYRPCDMNAIDPALTGFDFCWSCCALEHLGDLRKGLDFIINSINTLKPGGFAIHTTEFNLSSNERTLNADWCVLYRRRDFEALIAELRALGHEVEDFSVAPDSTVIDGYVDHPPFMREPHLRMQLEGFVTTSAGIVVRRGA